MVTGTSSGVGRSTALLLSGSGFEVLATVRNEADALALQKQNPDHIHPVIIELRNQGMIIDAVRQTADITGQDGLYGLVNCAAMLHCGPLEYFPRELWFEQYDVNLFGPMALTQAMLPLIRKANGRIVNIGAVGEAYPCLFTVPLPHQKLPLRRSMTV